MTIYRAVCIAIAVCGLGLAGCGGGDPSGDGDPDEDFLRQVRESATGGGGAEARSGTLQPGGRNPKIELETDHFQMGTIPYDAPYVSEMKVYNRGATELRITRITTTCACTTGKMRTPVIPAGGVGILEITVDPARIQGFFTTKTLTLFTNDPVNQYPSLDVTTYVEAEAEFEPQEFELGEVAQGAGMEIVVYVRQLQDYPLVIDDVGVFEDSAYFTAEMEQVPESEWNTPGKREYIVRAKMLPNTPPGDYQKFIVIHSNLKYQPSIYLPIKVSVLN